MYDFNLIDIYHFLFFGMLLIYWRQTFQRKYPSEWCYKDYYVNIQFLSDNKEINANFIRCFTLSLLYIFALIKILFISWFSYLLLARIFF